MTCTLIALFVVVVLVTAAAAGAWFLVTGDDGYRWY